MLSIPSPSMPREKHKTIYRNFITKYHWIRRFIALKLISKGFSIVLCTLWENISLKFSQENTCKLRNKTITRRSVPCFRLCLLKRVIQRHLSAGKQRQRFIADACWESTRTKFLIYYCNKCFIIYFLMILICLYIFIYNMSAYNTVLSNNDYLVGNKKVIVFKSVMGIIRYFFAWIKLST